MLCHISFAQEEKRLALVIGNSEYSSGKLNNAVNDANKVSAKLKTLGFDVILKNNTLHKQKIAVEIKENSSWIIVNKVKFISYIKENSESISVISLIPLGDGYINFPEIELFEYQSSQDDLPLKINNQNIHITMNFNLIRIKSKDKKLVKTAII